jgi:hypothetical protein
MHRKLIAVGAVLAVATAGTAAVVQAATAPPKTATVRAVTSFQVKINRYVKDGLRWQHDSYPVKSGGTVHIINLAADEGPHTFTIVKRADLPRTPGQINRCKICETLGKAHGADPNSEAPPKFLFLENGVGQSTPPNLDKPGDSAFVQPKKGFTENLHVTAKKGTTLYFMCLIHPWMQGKLLVR